MTGLIGTGAFLLPLMTIALFIYAIFFAKKETLNKKITYTYLLLLVLTGIFQIIGAPNIPVTSWFSHGTKGGLSGGFIGAVLITALRCLGDAGAYIILFSSLLVLAVLLFNISFVSIFNSIKQRIQTISAQNTKETKKITSERGVAVEPNIDKFTESKNTESDIVFNIPDDDKHGFNIDPEIKVYDDVTSGPEDAEPSE